MLYLSYVRYELNFAVNVLGTFSLTELMLPSLEKAAPDARVITVSSGGMYTSPLTTDLQVRMFYVCQVISFHALRNLKQGSIVCCSLVMPSLMGWYNMLEIKEFRSSMF